MNRDIKAEWVKRLRSGDYPQTRKGHLHDDEGYCCLGVLCQMAVEAGAVTWLDGDYFNGWAISGDEEDISDIRRQFPTTEVYEWAGLEPETPTVQVEDYDGYLIEKAVSDLNDDATAFAQLADLIEAQL